MRFYHSLAFLLAAAVAPMLHAAPTLYNQGNPSDQDQYLLQLLNRARQDPAGEGGRLAAWLRNTSYGQAIVRQFGTNPDKVQADFAALSAVPPFVFDPHLTAAAEAHTADLAANGVNGPGGDAHAGYDGSTEISRVQAAGFTGMIDGESVANQWDLYSVHASYLVDWGVPDLSHRYLAMDGSFGATLIGIGVATVPGQWPVIETQELGQPDFVFVNNQLTVPDGPAMLTGVVYHDANGNGQYDPGEGVAGVTITMDGGSFYAVTTASGGYSFPLVRADGSNADNTVSLHAKFADGSTADHTVSISRFATSQFGSYRANVEWNVQAATGGLPAFFSGANSLAQGWNYLSFTNGNLFGYYNTANYPFVYHNDMGWEYVLDANDGRAGVYLYDFASSSWFYTSPTFGFPYLYDFNRNAVLYYYPDTKNPGHYGSQTRYFYDFAAKKVVTL